MASNRMRRIAKELSEVKQDPKLKMNLEPFSGDDVTHLKGFFPGPPDTPYEDGTYQVDIQYPSEYPFKPPHMKFVTKIWHPNVSSQTGAICLDTLGKSWSPVLTIRSVLMSLQLLLAAPEPKDPQDAVVANQALNHPEEFKKIAQEWAVKYAGAPKRDNAGSHSGPSTEARASDSQQSPPPKKETDPSAYHGYNKEMIDRFCAMGFDVPTVVEAFEYFGIDKATLSDELEEEYMGDVTARLMGET